MKNKSLLLVIQLLLLVPTRTTVAQNGQPVARTAMSGKSVTMACSLPKSQPPQVRWVDLVYNSDRSPQLIFDSNGNPDFSIATSHPNQVNYKVDESFNLTISNCQLDNDPGQYMCYSIIDGKEYVQAYQLTVGEMLQCSGESFLRVNQETDLDCMSSFSGDNHPQLHWTATDPSGQSKSIPSQDRVDVRLSRHVARVTATPEDDGRKYTCHMSFGDLSEECSIVLNVTYPVQNVGFAQASRSVYLIDDELKCSASGNPRPSVTLSLSGKDSVPLDQKDGLGWSSIVIPASWLGEKITIVCTTYNVIDGVRNEMKTNTTFLVGKKEKPVTTTVAAEAVQAGSNNTIIIGLIIAAVVIVAVIIIVICVRKRKQKKRNDSKKRNNPNAGADAKLMPNNIYTDPSQRTHAEKV